MSPNDPLPSDSANPELPFNLERPIVFIDVQTTGPDRRTARIVRLSTLRIEPDGSEEFRSHLINPMSPITPGATNFHGITDEDVAECRPFIAYAKALHDYLDGCDLAGFGIRRFHLRVLRQEFDSAGIDFNYRNRVVLDAMEIYHRLEPRDIDYAYRRFVGGEFDKTSGLDATVNAARAILLGQLTQYPDLPSDPTTLERWASEEETENYIDDEGRFTLSDEGDPIINFGKYRGNTLYDMSEIDPDYLRWVASNESFTDEQRRIAADAAEGIMPDFE